MTRSSKILKNSAYLYFRMLIVLAASLYTVRVVLNALGVQDLGIYGIAGGMVAIFAFLNSTMTRAAQRFLGLDIGRNDPAALRRTFNAVLAANTFIAVLTVVISLTLGLWLLNYRLEIPSDRLHAANVVLFYSVATTVAMVLRTPYSALIISHQKMWFFTLTSVVEALLKLGVAFMISHSDDDRLTLYAALTCGVSWALFICYAAFCRVSFPASRLLFERNPELYRSLLAFTSWSFIGNLAHVFRTHGVNMLLNVFFGTSLNAAHSVMTQAQGAASQFTSSFELALSPQIYKSYGQGNVEEVRTLVFIGAKLNFLMFAILVAPAIYGMDFILDLWLGRQLDYLSAFVSWMLITQLIETLSQPLMVAAFAAGNIKRYQLAVGGTILLNLPLSWAAFHFGGSPTSFLYVAFAIQIATFALRVWFLKGMIQLHVRGFMTRVVVPLMLLSTVAVAIVALVTEVLPSPTSLWSFVKGAIAIEIPLLLGCLFIGFTSAERQSLWKKLLNARSKLRKNANS